MSNADYSWWRSALEGQWQNIAADDPPKLGFYRRRLFPVKSSPWAAVAIYEDGGGNIVAMQDQVVLTQPTIVSVETVWPRCARYPISEDEYRAVAERGEPWGSGLRAFNASELSKRSA